MRRIKRIFKLNLLSLFFIAVSFISITLAWFAYSGVARVGTDIPIKAWYIQIEKDGVPVSNEVVISLSEMSPGMDTTSEILKIQNLGDSGAELKYTIVSVRLFDEFEYYFGEDPMSAEEIEDKLANELPFAINMSLTKRYIEGSGDEGYFEVSVSWPLDSDNDEQDSLWGNKAYAFAASERAKLSLDSSYQVRPSIQVVISVMAEQYLGYDDYSDPKYQLGTELLLDVTTKKTCTTISSTCIKAVVIDVNNTLGDDTVTLLPTPLNPYLSGTYNDYSSLLTSLTTSWLVETRELYIEDILQVISNDVTESLLIRPPLSDSIIGTINNPLTMTNKIDKVIEYNGFYQYKNEKFDYLSSAVCYWVNSEYDTTKSFAIRKIDTDYSRVYAEDKGTSCKVLPVILADKADLE